MYPIKAYGTKGPKEKLAPLQITRRELGPTDVLIEILYCGICHTDIHQTRNEWSGSHYPMVPGHEIAGVIARVGAEVKNFKVGDQAGVGCLVSSCRKCPDCKAGEEQFCVNPIWTYNTFEKDGKSLTYGGYSTQIVVDESFVLSIPKNLPLDRAAPLLCAGITTYSPLRHWKAGKGMKVAVLGLGGLGHMAVKLAAAFGAEVTVLSRSNKKKEDAKKLGAHHFYATENGKAFEELARHFDLILNTVSTEVDLEKYMGMLNRDGSMVLLGVPEKNLSLPAFSIIGGRKHLTGSIIGGIRETQEMLNFCGKHNILCDIELIPIQKINEAYEKIIKGNVRYRFVIDLKSLK